MMQARCCCLIVLDFGCYPRAALTSICSRVLLCVRLSRLSRTDVDESQTCAPGRCTLGNVVSAKGRGVQQRSQGHDRAGVVMIAFSSAPPSIPARVGRFGALSFFEESGLEPPPFCWGARQGILISCASSSFSSSGLFRGLD
eukprot:5391903-Pyramimonas_sp.AAC.1